MKHFPQFSYHHVRYELPMAQGFALLAYAAASDPWVARELHGPGYIGQELDRIEGLNHGRHA